MSGVKTRAFGEARTEGTPDVCEYAGCKAPGAGEMRYHFSLRDGLPWTLCAEHLKPEHHPRDVKPEWLVRWPTPA